MELLFLGILVLLMIIALVSGFPVAFSLPGSSIIAIGLAALAGWMFADDPNAYFHEGGPVQWLSAGVTNFRSLYWNVPRVVVLDLVFVRVVDLLWLYEFNRFLLLYAELLLLKFLFPLI